MTKNTVPIFEALAGSAESVAPLLLGCTLERIVEGKKMKARIVEVEAYDQTDVASHSYNGRTPRTDIMFGPAGHLYVYFVYGMHYCCNVVVGEEGYGAAVLIRAVEPIDGMEEMRTKRGTNDRQLTNGPAKICQAMSIDTSMNGHDLQKEPLVLQTGGIYDDEAIVRTTRIGLSKGREAQWRFYIKDNMYVSKG